MADKPAILLALISFLSQVNDGGAEFAPTPAILLPALALLAQPLLVLVQDSHGLGGVTGMP